MKKNFTSCKIIFVFLSLMGSIAYANNNPFMIAVPGGKNGLGAFAPNPQQEAMNGRPDEVVPFGDDSKPVETFNLSDPKRLRDPFRRINLPKEVLAPKKDPKEMSPLELYDLAQYKVIGVIIGSTTPRAMIKYGTDQVYIVKEKQNIGNKNGFIKKIRWDGIVVVEKYIDEVGKVRKEEKLMALESASSKN